MSKSMFKTSDALHVVVMQNAAEGGKKRNQRKKREKEYLDIHKKMGSLSVLFKK